MAVNFISVTIQKPDSVNLILGQAHFIKTVEDLHEALVTAVPALPLGSHSASPQGRAWCAGAGPTRSWWSWRATLPTPSGPATVS